MRCTVSSMVAAGADLRACAHFVGGDGVTRPKDLIRIHVGLESVDSLIEDLDQALNTAID